jgi:hypothetical protein
VKNKLTKIGLVMLVIVLGSSYDLWRGYHEEGSIGTAVGYAVLGWIIFGIPVFVWYLLMRRSGKWDSTRR